MNTLLPIAPPIMQRARGTLRVAMRVRDGRTVLDDLYQEGCLKARMPRPVDWTEIVLLNSSGGVAGGDRLDVTVALAAGAQACVTAQAAERFYRALDPAAPSVVHNRLMLGEGTALEWMPQETILFDRAALTRRLDIDLAADARFLGVEMLVFGRQAMGERIRHLALADTIRLRRDGRLIWHDGLRFAGDPHSALSHRAIGGNAMAVASLLMVVPDAGERLAGLRAALKPFEGSFVEAGVSALDGLLTARLLAPNSAVLRQAVIAGLAVLRDGRALPRLWTC